MEERMPHWMNEKGFNKEEIHRFENYYAVFCINCLKKISNPVCWRCHMLHILLWLKDREVQTDKKKAILKKIKEYNSKENINETECVICGSNFVSLCSYCFYNEVARLFAKNKLSKEFIEDFKNDFNYEVYDNAHALH